MAFIPFTPVHFPAIRCLVKEKFSPRLQASAILVIERLLETARRTPGEVSGRALQRGDVAFTRRGLAEGALVSEKTARTVVAHLFSEKVGFLAHPEGGKVAHQFSVASIINFDSYVIDGIKNGQQVAQKSGQQVAHGGQKSGQVPNVLNASTASLDDYIHRQEKEGEEEKSSHPEASADRPSHSNGSHVSSPLPSPAASNARALNGRPVSSPPSSPPSQPADDLLPMEPQARLAKDGYYEYAGMPYMVLPEDQLRPPTDDYDEAALLSHYSAEWDRVSRQRRKEGRGLRRRYLEVKVPLLCRTLNRHPAIDPGLTQHEIQQLLTNWIESGIPDQPHQFFGPNPKLGIPRYEAALKFAEWQKDKPKVRRTFDGLRIIEETETAVKLEDGTSRLKRMTACG